LTQANAEVEAAIHPVDSLLGIILTLVIFEGSLLVGRYGALGPENTPGARLFVVILVIFSVMAWVIGTLAQYWPLKFMAWGLTLWVLLIELLMLLLDVVAGPLRTAGVWVAAGVVAFIPCAISFALLRWLVRPAYLRRLSTISGAVELIGEIDRDGKLFSVVLLVAGLATYVIIVCFLR
jgi:hypothetical protein